ncbi:MAG: hypothetical protein JXB60_02960 [Candidatus Cloacimonetes bacterium]|nr:hypothetical protein [Candidatus Cloacimonadota bacterium]
MKRLIVSLCSLFVIISLHSDLVNLNPDPDGDPWYAGGLRPLTAADWEKLDAMPRLQLPDNLRGRLLPARIDNSEQPYFRPIFTQDGGSCGQASGVGYNFTYAVDFQRNLPASFPENQYPTHYTWNFLNGGNGGGSWYWDGWEIINSNGCPNVVDYGGMSTGGHSRWMSGYNEYFSGMHNRTLEYFAIEVATPEGLETLKNWMNDHLDGSEIGGLANFGAGITGALMDYLPWGTPDAGMNVIIQWHPSVNHAMTFVGYDDSIRYDYNGDGYFTNDEDINADGNVDMKDWEIGGLIVANSWGTGWADQGKTYMMYKLLAEATADGGIWANMVHVLRARETYEPLITLKTTIEHDSRNKLRIYAGVAADTTTQEPELEWTFPLFNFQGGPLYMQGGNQEFHKTIEIGLDITPLLSGIEPEQAAKFFLIIENQDPENVGTGQIISYSIIDYTNAVPVEIISPEVNVPIVNNSTTMLAVNHQINYQGIEILTEELPSAIENQHYSFQMTAAYGTQPYNWLLMLDYPEITGEQEPPLVFDNILIPNNFDDGYAEIDLTFNFPFYFETYDHILISTDGSILFGNEFTYVRSVENLINAKAITPYGTDLEIFSETGDGMWYMMDETHLIVHWRESRYADPDFNTEFWVTLQDNGEIGFIYGTDITSSTAWCAGISNGDNTNFTIAEISGTLNINENHLSVFYKPVFPEGMSLTAEGIFHGTPLTAESTWEIGFKVYDLDNIFDTKILEFETLSSGNADHQLPELAVLHQNVPNPFSLHPGRNENGTKISFDLQQKSRVKLKIYNLKGQKIRTLLDEILNTGRHAVVWNGRTDDNKLLPGGIYLYRLETGSSYSTRKMLMLK